MPFRTFWGSCSSMFMSRFQPCHGHRRLENIVSLLHGRLGLDPQKRLTVNCVAVFLLSHLLRDSGITSCPVSGLSGEGSPYWIKFSPQQQPAAFFLSSSLLLPQMGLGLEQFHRQRADQGQEPAPASSSRISSTSPAYRAGLSFSVQNLCRQVYSKEKDWERRRL